MPPMNEVKSPKKPLLYYYGIILLIVRGVTAFIRVKQENRALRAESAELRRREHERLARRAAHRAHEAQLNRPEPDEDNYEEDEE